MRIYHHAELDATVTIPGSKSITHRAFLLAAHSDVPCRIEGWLDAADPNATLAAVEAFGAHIERGDGLTIQQGAWRVPKQIDCRNAGTALRLLLGLAARFDQPVRFTGDASLCSRPNGPLIEALRKGGATIDADQHAPLTIRGPIEAGQYALPARVSSQYGSSLLLSLPFLEGDSHLAIEAPIASKPYLDVTTDVAAAFGLTTAPGDIRGGQSVRCKRFDVEGDWSTAAFPFVAAAISGGRVTVANLDLDSKQGDRAILEHVRAFGASVDGLTVAGAELESPGDVDVSQTPDLFPALCILAACARGTTTFTGGVALRHKESDRIAAMAEGLRMLGIDNEERPDGLVVHGGRPSGGTVDARGDHRIHMAFAVAGLAAMAPVSVTDEESVHVSYPRFHELFEVPA